MNSDGKINLYLDQLDTEILCFIPSGVLATNYCCISALFILSFLEITSISHQTTVVANFVKYHGCSLVL